MREKFGRSLRSFMAGAALASLLAGGALGTGWIAAWASERILAEALEVAALDFARYAESRPAVETAGEAAGALPSVVGHRVYDFRGQPTGPGAVDAAALPPAVAQRVLRAQAPVIGSTGLAGEPATVYVALAGEGRPPQIAELRVDQSALRTRTEATLQLAAAGLLPLVGLCFGIPLLAFLRRHREGLAASERVAYYAAHEPMTGLMSRARFLAALDEMVAARNGTEGALSGFAVLHIDLDGLKEVNEAYSHKVGDEAIVAAARALRAAAGPDALVARLGGDEFAVACPGLASPAAVESFAASLVAAVAAPRTVEGHAVALTARIGAALFPQDGDGVLRLMKAADLALDRARKRPEPGTVLFERAIESELQRRRELENQIRETLASDAFDLHFQPLFAGGSGRLTGFEALLRMPAGAGGYVSPAVFVPIAEEMGLIAQIGDWVLRRACDVARHWPEPLTIAVNLSPAQFKAGGLSRTVRQALEQSGLAPRRLELEITEGLLLADDADIMQELADFKALGVSIVMDDFGTGYSSLSYLWKFPFDKIKIDRSFMRAFETDERHVATILQAILSLSRALRMRVTAEGVETPAQAAFLRELGCDEVQGFLFGRPMPLIDVAATILKDAQREEPETAPGLRVVGG
ncbi:MAG TPA: bifunctional diguanylate cyclase/phosphodiesterase [Beijerinckiaceae bacterium]|jgi:diguanylate cyclase (GGDEF)-like protein